MNAEWEVPSLVSPFDRHRDIAQLKGVMKNHSEMNQWSLRLSVCYPEVLQFSRHSSELSSCASQASKREEKKKQKKKTKKTKSLFWTNPKGKLGK